jgi:hypothetical protein
MDDLQPETQRKVGTLKDSSLADGKLTPAFLANVESKASGLAMHLANAAGITIAAMWANWSIRPKLAFDIRKGGSFIIEEGIIESRLGHCGISYGHRHRTSTMLCQV